MSIETEDVKITTICRKCGEPTNFTINGLCMICYGLVDEEGFLTVHLDK